MNLTAILPLIKLVRDSGVISPIDSGFIYRGVGGTQRPVSDSKKPAIPPTGKQSVRPDCGMGKKAKLQNGQWVCVPLFK